MNNVEKAAHNAKKRNENEFYTRYWNIQNEIENHDEYIEYFKGKRVCSPCNDYYGNFKRFFELNFDKLGLVEHTAVHYTGEVTLEHPLVPSKYFHMWRDETGVHKEDIQLKGNGDFRSMEIIDLMKKHDCICTNPPYGDATTFYSILKSIGVKFLFIGNSSFGALNEQILDYGNWHYGFEDKHNFQFRTTDLVVSRKTQEGKKHDLKVCEDMVGFDDNGLPIYENRMCVNELSAWYTNILEKGNIKKGITESYMNNTVVGHENLYPKVENVENCIAVLRKTSTGYGGWVKNIPCDWDGLMLVASSALCGGFIDSRYFEIVGNGNLSKDVALPLSDVTKQKYLEQTGKVASNGVCWYTNADGIVKGCGGGLFLLIKWKVKEREALKKELGL